MNIFCIIMLLGSVACTPSSPESSRRGLKTANVVATPDPKFNFQDDSANPPLYWYTSKIIPNTLIVNKAAKDVVYLRGQKVHNFLNGDNQHTQVYCLVLNFPGTTAPQLRLRAIPTVFNNTKTNIQERLMRIDLAESLISSQACAGTIDGQTSSSLTTSFAISEVCINCNSQVNSNSLKLFQVASNSIDDSSLVDTSKLPLEYINMALTFENSDQNTGGACNQSACQAQGFDCCVENQCVKDRSVKSNASSNPDYDQAMAEFSINPLYYLNWPGIFNICSNTPGPIPTSTIPPDAVPTAVAELEQHKKDYRCLEEESDADCCDQDYSTTCGVTYRENVRIKVWQKCGCTPPTNTPIPGDPNNMCIGISFKQIFSSTGSVIQVACSYENPDASPTPFQNLNIDLPARSAPHRFFDSFAVNYDDLSTASDDKIQEGQFFEYLDSVNFTEPENGTFNMNSVLGQMTVDLNGALPAKVINLEHGQVYLININSGYYTPCPQCVKDNWFNLFTAHPKSNFGTGVSPIGYSTQRDLFDENRSMGNYEDSIFGRACWLPPTMIPFSHRPQSPLQTQRLDRLSTQAAFYINGYQRDWYGFNKGAIIGSFDGVRWFAIGKSRRVLATSTKLFLAINAPFADLAEPSSMSVSVIENVPEASAATYDYDPNVSISDPDQNSGATCQAYHQCETDTDCVTRLGWEYMCANVDQVQTLWPKFTINAVEQENTSTTIKLVQMLQEKKLPSGSSKRCVYRGNGAPCSINIAGVATNVRKNFMCATNFYCASISSNFNDELARVPAYIDNILYGKENDVLGRPLHYLGGTASLDSTIVDNLEANGALHTGIGDNIGICKPGRGLSSTFPNIQHDSVDASRRTDYISQIAGCRSDATVLTYNRTTSCPAFDSTGNLIHAQDAVDSIGTTIDLEDVDFSIHYNGSTRLRELQRNQNACGGESFENTTLEAVFEFILAGTLQNTSSISEPMLVQDACFRRAGSACHTDLDCFPNKLHQQQAELLSDTQFGNEAERLFFTEALVCGQASPKPIFGSSNFDSYNMSLNRCCREVGKDFTMRTGGDAGGDDRGTDENLNAMVLAHTNPSANNRYSRYSTVEDFGSSNKPSPEVHESPANNLNLGSLLNQWKSVNEAGTKNCCGGGFIRKFADGTHNWQNNRRITFPTESFKCLNYMNKVTLGYNTSMDSFFNVGNNYDSQLNRLCVLSEQGGCIQKEMNSNLSSVEVPVPLQNADNSSWNPSETLGSFDFFSPYDESSVILTNISHATLSNGPTFLGTSDRVAFMLPLFIGSAANITGIDILDEDGTTVANIAAVGACGDNTTPALAAFWPAADAACIGATNNETYSGVLRIRRSVFVEPGSFIIHFNPPGTPDSVVGDQDGVIPGNDFYYLSKLGRFELLGIPQIFYEPIYCNSDQNELVPNFFENVTDRTGFDADSLALSQSAISLYEENLINDPMNSTHQVVLKDQVELSEVFSPDQFSCCLEAGTTVKLGENNKCCSNFTINGGGTDRICALPPGTDLHVYLNRYVSSEGVSTNVPSDARLVENDFNPYTGEPLYQDTVTPKIIKFGETFCASKTVRRGGAFGHFRGEPHNGTFFGELVPLYSILDSPTDADEEDPTRGIVPFNQGFRWNHHIYCQ